jgi:hypothetical protein
VQNQEEIVLPIVSKQKTITFKVIVGLCICLGLTSIISYIEVSLYKHIVFFIFGITSLISSLFLEIRSKKIKEYKIIGQIQLSPKIIHLDTNLGKESFNLSEIFNLEVVINETSRDPAGYMEGSWGINKFRDGIKNSISFRTENNEYYSFKILIEDIQVIDLMEKILNNLNIEFKLIRNGQIIKSIKQEHYLDYPPEHINTKN